MKLIRIVRAEGESGEAKRRLLQEVVRCHIKRYLGRTQLCGGWINEETNDTIKRDLPQMTGSGDGRSRTPTWSSAILCSSPQTMLTLMTCTLCPIREPFFERMGIELGLKEGLGLQRGVGVPVGFNVSATDMELEVRRSCYGSRKEAWLTSAPLVSFLSAFPLQLLNPSCIFQLVPLLPYLPTTLNRFSL